MENKMMLKQGEHTGSEQTEDRENYKYLEELVEFPEAAVATSFLI